MSYRFYKNISATKKALHPLYKDEEHYLSWYHLDSLRSCNMSLGVQAIACTNPLTGVNRQSFTFAPSTISSRSLGVFFTVRSYGLSTTCPLSVMSRRTVTRPINAFRYLAVGLRLVPAHAATARFVYRIKDKQKSPSSFVGAWPCARPKDEERSLSCYHLRSLPSHKSNLGEYA